jgi:hypothetical protein
MGRDDVRKATWSFPRTFTDWAMSIGVPSAQSGPLAKLNSKQPQDLFLEGWRVAVPLSVGRWALIVDPCETQQEASHRLRFLRCPV